MAYPMNTVIISGTLPSPVVPKTSKSGRLYAKFEIVQTTKSGTMRIPVMFLDSDKADELSRLPVNMEIAVLGTIRTETKTGASGTAYTVISIMGEGFYKKTPRANGNGGWSGYQQQPTQQSYNAPQTGYNASQDETPLAF